MLFSLLIDAFSTGALVSAFGRYEGRIIWLLPFCAVAGCLVLYRLKWNRLAMNGLSKTTS